jgi:hypothetical protein
MQLICVGGEAIRFDKRILFRSMHRLGRQSTQTKTPRSHLLLPTHAADNEIVFMKKNWVQATDTEGHPQIELVTEDHSSTKSCLGSTPERCVDPDKSVSWILLLDRDSKSAPFG